MANPPHRAQTICMDRRLDRFDALIGFLGDAQALKDTLRSGRTAEGRRESVAEHSWGLCLLALLVEPELDGIDIAKLLKLCILHDLGEAVSGDIPAIHQTGGPDKAMQERADFVALTAALPDDLRRDFVALWDEYEAGETPEAQLAKGLDKLETMIQHVNGRQEPGFDYLWNLGYGTDRTARTPLLQSLRRRVDRLTRKAARR